jgi:1-acyl-sn-glycerol-3-phosphate acyltransferase
MRPALRLLAMSCAIMAYIITSLPGYLILRGNARLVYCTHLTSWYCRIGLFILGVKVSVINNDEFPREGNVMLVSNHLSYIDILIIAAQQPTLFITSREIRQTFFLCFISALGGSIFVDRRRISGVRNDINMIARYLVNGFTVCFFPEATSTDGSEVLPFKSTFFEAAKRVGSTITPLCIRYTSIDGNPADKNNRDLVCFYGEMTFFSHFIKLMPLKGIEVEMVVTSGIISRKYPRKDMAKASFKRILEAYFA